MYVCFYAIIMISRHARTITTIARRNRRVKLSRVVMLDEYFTYFFFIRLTTCFFFFMYTLKTMMMQTENYRRKSLTFEQSDRSNPVKGRKKLKSAP